MKKRAVKENHHGAKVNNDQSQSKKRKEIKYKHQVTFAKTCRAEKVVMHPSRAKVWFLSDLKDTYVCLKSDGYRM